MTNIQILQTSPWNVELNTNLHTYRDSLHENPYARPIDKSIGIPTEIAPRPDTLFPHEKTDFSTRPRRFESIAEHFSPRVINW